MWRTIVFPILAFAAVEAIVLGSAHISSNILHIVWDPSAYGFAFALGGAASLLGGAILGYEGADRAGNRRDLASKERREDADRAFQLEKEKLKIQRESSERMAELEAERIKKLDELVGPDVGDLEATLSFQPHAEKEAVPK